MAIYITETLRIRRHDKHNLVVEVLQDVTRRQTGEVEKQWCVNGYHGTIESAGHEALHFMANSAVAGYEAVQDCERLLQAIRDAQHAVARAIRTSSVAV